MSTGSGSPATFLEYVGPKLDASRLLSWLHILSPAAATLLVTLGQSLQDRGDWAYVIGGIATLSVTAAMDGVRTLYRSRKRDSELTDAGKLRVTLKDALQPIAEMLADMQRMTTKSARIVQAGQIAQQSCSALALLFTGIDDVRVVVYRVDSSASPRRMDAVQTNRARDGRSASPFIEGEDRGNAAFAMLVSGEPCFVSDVCDPIEVQNAVGAYAGTRDGYRTFISAPITDDQNVYGMVNVDAPDPKVFVDTDKQLVALVADLLAIGYASIR